MQETVATEITDATEEHPGKWKDCRQCGSGFKAERYVYYGTNEYTFEKLENPSAYEPIKCSKCGTVISLSEGGYSMRGREYWCEQCS
jgi:hypothetical protein